MALNSSKLVATLVKGMPPATKARRSGSARALKGKYWSEYFTIVLIFMNTAWVGSKIMRSLLRDLFLCRENEEEGGGDDWV